MSIKVLFELKSTFPDTHAGSASATVFSEGVKMVRKARKINVLTKKDDYFKDFKTTAS